jgi:hypothetical protein
MLLLPPLGWYEPLRFTFWNHDVYQHPMMSLPSSQLRLFRTERLLWRCLEGFGQPLPGRALIICLRNTRPQGNVNHDDQIDPNWWHSMVAWKLKRKNHGKHNPCPWFEDISSPVVLSRQGSRQGFCHASYGYQYFLVENWCDPQRTPESHRNCACRSATCWSSILSCSCSPVVVGWDCMLKPRIGLPCTQASLWLSSIHVSSRKESILLAIKRYRLQQSSCMRRGTSGNESVASLSCQLYWLFNGWLFQLTLSKNVKSG